MSKTLARGAHVVTDTLRQNSRPIISFLDQNSLRQSLRRSQARRAAGGQFQGKVGSARPKQAIAVEPAPAHPLYILMDAGSPTLSGIPLENIQQAIEFAILQLVIQQQGSASAISEGLWSMVAAGAADGIAATEEKLAPQQPAASEQLKEPYKFKVATAAQLRDRVLAKSEWLTAQEVSENAGYKNANPSGQPNKWKKAGRIFAITVDGKDRFPAYALGVDGKPLPQMAEVLSVLCPHRQPLAIASWFASANSWLGSKTPMESIADNPQGVLKAAKMEVAPIEHG